MIRICLALVLLLNSPCGYADALGPQWVVHDANGLLVSEEAIAAAFANTRAVSPAPTPSIEERVTILEHDYKEAKDKPKKEPKDIWDVLTAVSGIFSGVVIALLGLYATDIYKKREASAEERKKNQEFAISRIQTVEKFFLHLTSQDERIKRAAIVAINALGDGDLAIRVAEAFASPGATSALTTIATTASSAVAAQAERVLLDLFAYLKPRVITIHRREQRVATGFIVSRAGEVVTSAHAIDLIPPSELMVGMPDDVLVPAKVAKVDSEADLALLTVASEDNLLPLSLTASTPAISDKVTALFVGQDASLRLEIGTVALLALSVSGLPGMNEKIGVSFQSLPPGSSGTPVIDSQGQFVGLIQGTVDKITLLIPAANVIQLTQHQEERPPV